MDSLPQVAAGRRLAAAAALLLVLCGCGQASPPAMSSTPLPTTGSLGDIPSDQRLSTGGADPRTSAYWITWSTCGDGSQADVARQNGGRSAGWILLDDLLADPGLALGDQILATCEEAIAALSPGAGIAPEDPVDALARQALTAELNLSAGAESCEAADKIVRFAQLLLSAIGYDASGPARSPDAREQVLVSEARSALADYNTGTLCR